MRPALVARLLALACLSLVPQFEPIVAMPLGVDPRLLAGRRDPLDLMRGRLAPLPPEPRASRPASVDVLAGAPIPGYAVTELEGGGPRRGGLSLAHSINERGQVVGANIPDGGTPHAALWENGALTNLGTLGGYLVEAMDINEHGQVVGTNWDAEGARAFLWQDGLMIDLGSLGGRPFSEAWGINGKGQVVGSSRDTFGGIESSRGFLWQDGVMTDLGTLGGGWSYATDINDQSQVVGYGGTATGEWYSFLWQNGQMTDLGGPTGPQMLAAAINERGQVVGTMFVPTGQHAFLWENGRTIDLGALDGRYSIAFDINERGQVVGETGLPSTPTYGSEIDGFIWEGGVMAALGGGPYGRPYYTHAWGINNRGQIAGDANSGALLWSPSHSSSAAAAIDTRGHGGESTINARSFGWTDAAPARLIRVLSPSGRAPLEFGIRGLPAGSYSARIFDVQGRLVRRWEGFSGDASTRDTWDGRAEDGSRAGTGMYLLRVDAGGRTLSAKLLLVR